MTVESDALVESIKSGPSWRFLFRPGPYVQSRMHLEDVLPTFSKATVRLRGWDFPHMNPHKPPVTGQNFISSSDEFQGHLEYWRAYTSGQLIYLSSVREATEPGWRDKLERGARNRIVTHSETFDWSSVPGFIDVQNLIYTVAEFFEFSARVSQAMPGTETTKLTVSLHNVAGFVLMVDDIRRGWWEYHAADYPDIGTSTDVSLSELVGSSNELALEAIKALLVRFGWSRLNMEFIKADLDDYVQDGR